jgi:AcrR family transcriptional regulator
MTGKRTAHERFPEVLAAAVRVFARDGYRSAHMSDVAREAGLSEAALYRYVDSKEGLFVLAIRHALLLEPLPGEDEPGAGFPLAAPSLAEMIRQARDFVAAEVPFGALAEALRSDALGWDALGSDALGTQALGSESWDRDRRDDPAGLADPAAELELIMRELFALEEQTARAADMIERSARELPELADLLNTGLRGPVLDALTEYLGRRAKSGELRETPDTAATARLVLETLTWFARHRHSDPYGAAIPSGLAQDTAIDALLHALVPPHRLAARQGAPDLAGPDLAGPDLAAPAQAARHVEGKPG